MGTERRVEIAVRLPGDEATELVYRLGDKVDTYVKTSACGDGFALVEYAIMWRPHGPPDQCVWRLATYDDEAAFRFG